MAKEFEIGTEVYIMCFDGAEFRGVLHDFTDAFFVLKTKTGVLGFPYEDVRLMNAV